MRPQQQYLLDSLYTDEFDPSCRMCGRGLKNKASDMRIAGSSPVTLVKIFTF